MSRLCWSVRSLLLLLFSVFSAALNISAPVFSQRLQRRAPFSYHAIGDSYAAGIGAGEPLSQASPCDQYSESYPNLLNKFFTYGESIPLEAYHACPGASAEKIIKDQSVDREANMVTVGFGLEDINFAKVINDCVYLFGVKGDCEATLHTTMMHLEAQFSPKVRDVIQNLLEGPRLPRFRVFLIGFARFWNDQTDLCDKTSWNYWETVADKPSFAQMMTQNRRRKMNEWIRRVNEILEGVVTAFEDEGETRVQFVNIDDAFEGHRFCEDNRLEPQADLDPRPDVFFFQYDISEDQHRGVMGPGQDMFRWLKTHHGSPARKFKLWNVSKFYSKKPVIADMPMEGPPIILSKIFHPTPAGHRAIADAIEDAIPDKLYHVIDSADRAASPVAADISRRLTTVEERSAPAQLSISEQPSNLDQPRTPTNLDHQPIIRTHRKRQSSLVEQEATCSDRELSLNFPRSFQLDDGRFSAAEILRRIRDQVCKGICGNTPTIPPNLVRFQKQSETGCDYAVRVGPLWEMYFSSTMAGENCVEASNIVIDKCMTPVDFETRLRYNGTIDGPNDGESYQIGVRQLNGPGSNHPAFSADNKEHLPYMQLALSVKRSFVNYKYQVQIFGWDDGLEGKSLEIFMRENIDAFSYKYNWRKSFHFYFHDGTYAEHYFSMRTSQGKNFYPNVGFDKFWHLEPGSFLNHINRYTEVPIWHDEDYDTTYNRAFGVAE